mgnify:CR=1 FL=1
MKALSIIGIVASILGILVGLGACFVVSYESNGNGDYYPIYPSRDSGEEIILISCYFLAFSIVATVVSFKKQNSNSVGWKILWKLLIFNGEQLIIQEWIV